MKTKEEEKEKIILGTGSINGVGRRVRLEFSLSSSTAKAAWLPSFLSYVWALSATIRQAKANKSNNPF